MLNIIISLVAACFAACSPEQAKTQTAPASGVTTAAPAAQTVRISREAPTVRARAVLAGQPMRGVHVVDATDDEDNEDDMPQLQALAALANLDGLDEEIAEAIEQAMSAQNLASLAALNGHTWHMAGGEVEYDDNAAFLGVSSEPVNAQTAAQLPIVRGTGLMLTTVEEGSAASSAGLKQLDVIAKLDDQMLVNSEQLAALIRSHKAGDDVKVTYLRGGKESTVTVKLGERKLPKLRPGGARADGGFEIGNNLYMVPSQHDSVNKVRSALLGAHQGLMPANGARLRVAPGPGNSMAYVYGMGGKPGAGATAPMIWRGAGQQKEDVDSSNMAVTYATDEVSIEYRSTDGKVHVTVKDLESDTTVFDQDRAPNKDELAAMDEDVRKAVERLLEDIRANSSAKPGVLRVPGAPAAPPAPPAVPVPPQPASPSVTPDVAVNELPIIG